MSCQIICPADDFLSTASVAESALIEVVSEVALWKNCANASPTTPTCEAIKTTMKKRMYRIMSILIPQGPGQYRSCQKDFFASLAKEFSTTEGSRMRSRGTRGSIPWNLYRAIRIASLE